MNHLSKIKKSDSGKVSLFPYLPQTPADIDEMLEVVGAEDIDELFRDIPDFLKKNIDIAAGISERELYSTMRGLADRNETGVSFLGAGCYDHIIPAVVPYVVSRSEFLTAYTPYQAEISQGLLQAIFEFQTMISMLTGLPVPNASLYDGATAASEACSMAVQSRRKSNTVIVSSSVHPYTIEVIDTYFSDLGIEIKRCPCRNGETDREILSNMIDAGTACVFLQSPNFYGIVEDLSGYADAIHSTGALMILSSNPLSLGVLKNQAAWGADIAVGDAQPLGLAQSFGGPSVGYIASTTALMRKIPGRIVGQSVDTEGQRAFVLTLQAREQHIKRERATSNICTNQALAALAVSVYLSALGKDGFRSVSAQNAHKARYLAEKICEDTSAELVYERPFFNEFVLNVKGSSVELRDRFLEVGILAGIPLVEMGEYSERSMLVAVTEKRTRPEMDMYVETFLRLTS